MTLTIIGTYLISLWFIVTAAAYGITRNIAAPQLMFCAVLGFFFFDIFISDHSIYMYGTYVISLLVVLLSCFFNTPIINKPYSGNTINYFDVPTITLWLASIPAIISMLYMVAIFDGLASYLVAAKHGTKSFYGLGPLKSIILTIYPISLYYFALLISQKRSYLQYLIYAVHLAILVSISLLSLSRGGLLSHFVFMALIWHFARKRISPIIISGGLVLLLSIASIYGVVRETVSLDEGALDLSIETHSSGQIAKSEWMEFGTFPFESIINESNTKKHWGSTYVTAITNFIPRKIWPNKPDPGGVIFTNEYAPGMYDEYSHFTTGLYPEAMINFGKELGIVIGTIQLFLMCVVLSIYYKKIVYNFDAVKSRTPKKMLSLVIYLYIVWASVMFLTGEFTSLVVATIIKIVTATLVYTLSQIRLSKA